MMPINDFGIRSVPPCGDCDERGHCTMNCGPAMMDAAAEQVLRYKPKATTKAKKKRQRKARKAAKTQ